MIPQQPAAVARTGGLYVGGRLLRFAVQMLAIVVLARLLTPADFGVMAFATSILALLTLLRDFGLGTATVRAPAIDDEQLSWLFWMNLAVGAVLGLGVAAVGPGIAALYGDARLAALLPVLAIGFAVGGLTVQHEALLRRDMQFRALIVRELAGTALGVVVGVGAAWSGAGLWSLAAMTLSQQLFHSAALWRLCAWRPAAPRRGVKLAPLLSFARNLTGHSVAEFMAGGADRILVGWWWGSSMLGLYDKAFQLLMLPIYQLVAPLGVVMIPVLSRIDDRAAFRARHVAVVRLLLMATVPAVTMLLLTAEIWLTLVLGPQWVAAAAIFARLGIGGLVLPLLVATQWVFIAQGKADRLLPLTLINGGASVSALLLSAPFGTEAMALAYALSIAGLQAPLAVVFAVRRAGLTWGDHRDMLLPAGLALPAVWLAIEALRAAGWLDHRAAPAVLLAATAAAAAATYLMVAGGRRGLGDACVLVRANIVALIRPAAAR